MKLLIDMNLSPKWVSVLEEAGWEAVHWSKIGQPNSVDHEILGYAKSNGYVIFTHDLILQRYLLPPRPIAQVSSKFVSKT